MLYIHLAYSLYYIPPQQKHELDVCEVVPPQVVLAATSSHQVKFEELFNGVASYQQRVFIV